jgi:hypothetical protein
MGCAASKAKQKAAQAKQAIEEALEFEAKQPRAMKPGKGILALEDEGTVPLRRIMCQFGSMGDHLDLTDGGRQGDRTKRVVVCRSGPSTAVSLQHAYEGLLAWTLRVGGTSPYLMLGACPAGFSEDCNRVPTELGWLCNSAGGQEPGMARVRVMPGDLFAVVADLGLPTDLTPGRLTIHQAAGGSNGQWQCVLDTRTLQGSVRLCACLFGGGEVELLNMRWQGTPAALVSRYEQSSTALVEGLGPQDPSTLSSQHILAQAYAAVGKTQNAEEAMQLALAGREVVLGATHEHTQKSKERLRQIKRMRAEAEAAERNRKRHERTFGKGSFGGSALTAWRAGKKLAW